MPFRKYMKRYGHVGGRVKKREKIANIVYGYPLAKQPREKIQRHG